MRTIGSFLILGVLLLTHLGVARAEQIARPAFERLWQRTGIPIQQDIAAYSWIWGPEPFSPLLQEAFDGQPQGWRAVQYFDKARMEINNPEADPNAPWYVTNGLLVNELAQGQVQVGVDAFIPLGPADIPIAGDPDNTFPTYASLAYVYNSPVGRALGDHVTGAFLGAEELSQYANDAGTEIVRLERGFGIPRAFWDSMNRTGMVYENGRLVSDRPLFDWLFTLGYPTTEAFWTRVRVGGVEREVMFQAFERRVLTYTPSNPLSFQVEMGNVGRHYYQWRYEAPFANNTEAVITVPEDGALVSPPLLVQGFGSGSAFEGAITVRLKDAASGTMMASVNAQVRQADVGQPGPFTATLPYTPPAQLAPATIEVVTRSPRDGAEILLASRDVIATTDGPPQGLAEQIERVRRDLGIRLRLNQSAIRLTAVEPTEWQGGALGCPAPERAYTMAIVPGYRLTLEAQGQQFNYHTDRSDQFVLCRDGRPVLGLVSSAEELIAALRERGYTVEGTGDVRQPFLQVGGTRYRISDAALLEPAELQVYSYGDVESAAADATGIGPDGQPEGTSVEWAAPPHFYRSWRTLAIYAGSDQVVAGLLSELLGPPFAAPDAPAPTRVSWEKAKALILDGLVAAVFQAHSLEVTLTLKDGRQLITTEPEIDAVLRVIEECGEPCADIRVATE